MSDDTTTSQTRWQALREGLRREGVRALVIFADHATDPDLAPFLPPIHAGRCLLIVPAERPPKLAYFTPMEREEAARSGLAVISPEELDLGRWQRDYPHLPGQRLAAALGQAFLATGVGPGQLLLAGHGGAGEIVEACRELEPLGFHFSSGHGAVRRFCKSKTGSQLERIRQAAAATGTALRAVAKLLASARVLADGSLEHGTQGLTVGRLRQEIAVAVAAAGCEQPEGNLVAPAEEGAVPHNAGRDDRILRAGESLVVDLYPRCAGLFADCTRTFCVGPPPANLAEAHGAVLEALQQAHRQIEVGLRGAALQSATQELFATRGYASGRDLAAGYVHGLGHGVGYRLHEDPSFRREAAEEEARLEVGDVFTLEPGLYDPGAGYGVRLEDLLHLTTDGLDNLTPWPYDLDPTVWLT
jgi:Xaa-Pro aminopeptidase